MDDESKRAFEEGWKVGFEAGREVVRREGLPFAGVDPLPLVHDGAGFKFEKSWIDSFVAYERTLTECLRSVQRARWLRASGPETMLDPIFSAGQSEIESELNAARSAVDAEVDRGLGRPRIVDALRGPPRRPAGVREYRDIGAFVEEDRRRGVYDWPHRLDAGGSDWGVGWRLERAIRRWETTSWRVSWLGHGDRTNELYALESPPPGERSPVTRRVWVLGSPASWKEVEAIVSPLLSIRHERNSLIAVANAVSAALGPQLPPDEDF